MIINVAPYQCENGINNITIQIEEFGDTKKGQSEAWLDSSMCYRGFVPPLVQTKKIIISIY